MEQSFASLSVSDTDHKLTRAASFSELSTVRKVIVEQHYQPFLFKQHSCEQIFDKNSNISQTKVLQAVSFPAKSPAQNFEWKKPLPVINVAKASSSTMEFSRSFASVIRENKCNDRIEKLSAELGTLERSHSQGLLSMNSMGQLDEDIQRLSINRPMPRRALKHSKLKFSDVLKKHPEEQRVESPTPQSFISERTIEQLAIEAPEPEQESRDASSSEDRASKTRKRLRSLIPEQAPKVSMGWFWPLLFFVLLPIALIFVSVAFNQEDLVNQFCSPVMNFSKAAEEVQSCVHGQRNGIVRLAEYLKFQKNGFAVLALVGGTGVGKSYTASILKQNLARKHSAFQYFPPLPTREKDAYEALSACSCNLLILENLRNQDIEEAAVFSRVLKQRAKNYCILVLALFNTQQTNDHMFKSLDMKSSVDEIEKSFRNENVNVDVITYDPLDNETLDYCIMEAAEYLKIQLTKRESDYIRQGLILSQSGCKGAYSKVQLVGRNLD